MSLISNIRSFNGALTTLPRNRKHLPTAAFSKYCSVCKFLLEQKKLSADIRKTAITLLGSPLEQEAFFSEYQMHEELAELYGHQGRYRAKFRLLLKNGHMEEALNVALSIESSSSQDSIPETEIAEVLDYLWAQRLNHEPQDTSTAVFEDSRQIEATSEAIQQRSQQWASAGLIKKSHSVQNRQSYVAMGNGLPKTFVALLVSSHLQISYQIPNRVYQIALDHSQLPAPTNLEDVPFEALQDSIELATNLALQNDAQSWIVFRLMTGLWKTDKEQYGYAVLPRSPLRSGSHRLEDDVAHRQAKTWVFSSFSRAILALDNRLRDLWSQTWPNRCSHYLTRSTPQPRRYASTQLTSNRHLQMGCKLQLFS